MADHSSIEWTEATWNPITGCSIVSPVPTPPPVIAAKPKAKVAKGRPLQSRGFEKSDTPRAIPSRPFAQRPRLVEGVE